MSTTTESPTVTLHSPDPPQYSWSRVLAIWALAAIPMGLAAWVFAPRMADWWDDGLGMLRALLITLTLGLVWQAVLVVLLLRREGVRTRSEALSALWLRSPQSPKTGRVGGRVWWAVAVAAVVLIALTALPSLSGPDERNLELVLESDQGQQFFLGNWGWFLLVAALLIFNTFLGEELLFRGILLPRMQAIGGRFAWLWNTVLFALYHVHQPWTMVNVVLASTVFNYFSQRYRSAWMGIITHSFQSVLIIGLVLALVLGAGPS